METIFVKVRTSKDIAISASVVILGLVLAFMPWGMGVNIAGYTLAIIGVIIACVLKSGYKTANNDAIFKLKQLTYEPARRSEIMKAMSSKPEALTLAGEGDGLTLRLDIYYSTASEMAYIQLSEYVPHEYKPCSDVYEYNKTRVIHLLK